MVQPHTTVRCEVLTQDSPGPVKRTPGVCLQEPRGADAVGGRFPTHWRPEPPGALQVQRQRAGFRDRLSQSVSPLLMTSLRFLSQQRGAREIPGGDDKQGVCFNLQRDILS